MLGLKIQALKDKQEDTSYLLHDLANPLIHSSCKYACRRPARLLVPALEELSVQRSPWAQEGPSWILASILLTQKRDCSSSRAPAHTRGSCQHLPEGPSSSTDPSAGSDRTSDVAPEGADRVPGWALEPGLRAPPAGAPALLRAADSRWSRWAPLLPDLLQTRPRSL